MPYLETVEELAEALADMLGIYNQGLRFEGMTTGETRAMVDATGDILRNHADDCACRMCWCGRIEARIRAAVVNDRHLSRVRRGVPCEACNEEDGAHLIGCENAPRQA